MDPNFTPGSDEYEQQLFQEQQDFLYSVLISSLKTEFSEALVKDHEGDALLILDFCISIIQATPSTPDLRATGSPSI